MLDEFTKNHTGINLKNNPESMSKMYDHAEAAKIGLSHQKKYTYAIYTYVIFEKKYITIHI